MHKILVQFYIMITTDRDPTTQRWRLHIRETHDCSKPICIRQWLQRIQLFFLIEQKKAKLGDQNIEKMKWVVDQKAAVWSYIEWYEDSVKDLERRRGRENFWFVFERERVDDDIWIGFWAFIFSLFFFVTLFFYVFICCFLKMRWYL